MSGQPPPPFEGQYPPQQGQYPPQQGQYPPQQGQYPPQQGQYPPQQGQYPPQQGQYPPQQGQYPPQQGQYPPQYGPPPVMSQPGAPQFQPAPIPTNISGCPPGLEHFMTNNEVFVEQRIELLEALNQQLGCCYEGKNGYRLLTSDRQFQLYTSEEESDCCERACCAGLRGFSMQTFDNAGQVVLELERPYKLPCACFPCALQEMTVSSHGNVIGIVRQPLFGGFFIPKLEVCSPDGTIQYTVDGNSPCICAFGDANFLINDTSGQQVGGISRKFECSCGGMAREMLTDADRYTLQFPPEANAEMRATLYAATLLVDYMFFEDGGNANAADQSVKLGDCYCCGCVCACQCSGGSGDN